MAAAVPLLLSLGISVNGTEKACPAGISKSSTYISSYSDQAGSRDMVKSQDDDPG